MELVRRAIEAWNRGDVDAILATLHPDVEYVTTGLFPGLEPVYHGHDGFRRFWQDFREIWESLSICDELCFFPTSTDPQQVDLLADAIGI